jgi:alcohol dehydrogenase (cytochrome c)
MGKLGILWQLDRTNGTFISAHDLGYQTLVDVDTASGRVAYRPNMLPRPGVELQFCPDINGVRGWHAMAYDPARGALVIPIRPGCQTGVFFDKVDAKNIGEFSWYGNTALNGSKLGPVTRHPKMTDHAGELIAMDVDTGQVRWRVPMPASSSLSALTTAGGIAVSGDEDRNLYVVDTSTGRVLFRARLPAPLNGSAVTYAVRGRQYIAVGTRAAAGRGGNAIYAFALPEGTRQAPRSGSSPRPSD